MKTIIIIYHLECLSYFEKLSKSEFVICPVGVELDTHKIYETFCTLDLLP